VYGCSLTKQPAGEGKAVKPFLYPVIALLVGCGGEQQLGSYVCEDPLDKYLDRARANIANDYDVERSSRLLTVCPDQGFHRHYTFSFHPSAIVARRATDASVRASWCMDAAERQIEAKLDYSPSMLTFQFTYPWSTETGKFPRTEFRLNPQSMRGGFFEEMAWSCRLVQPPEGAQATPSPAEVEAG
jgi:hypothetical protein